MLKFEPNNLDFNSLEMVKYSELQINFYPNSKDTLINNDFEVNCDRISIIKDVGITFYLKENIIKSILAKNVLVCYVEKFKTFKIIYTDYDRKLENRDFDIYSKSFFIRYITSKNIPSKKIYKVGEEVIPSNALFPAKVFQTKPESSFGEILANYLVYYIYEKEPRYKEIIKAIDDLFNIFKCRIVSKDTQKFDNNNNIYIVEHNPNKQFLSEFEQKKYFEFKNLKDTYLFNSIDEHLQNYEEFKADVLEMYEQSLKRRA